MEKDKPHLQFVQSTVQPKIKLHYKEILAKNRRIMFAKSHFISIFNEKRLTAKKMGDNEVIMTDYEYFMISDCYDEIYNKFISKKFKWKHFYEIGYIKISWDRFFVLNQ